MSLTFWRYAFGSEHFSRVLLKGLLHVSLSGIDLCQEKNFSLWLMEWSWLPKYQYLCSRKWGQIECRRIVAERRKADLKLSGVREASNKPADLEDDCSALLFFCLEWSELHLKYLNCMQQLRDIFTRVLENGKLYFLFVSVFFGYMSGYLEFNITVTFMEIMVKNMVHLTIKETLILWPVAHSQFCACFTVPSTGWMFNVIFNRAFS